MFSFIFIHWRLITLQYCSGFCHTLTWISHGIFLTSKAFCIGVYPINNVIVSGKQWRDSAIHIHVSILPQTPLPFSLAHNTKQGCWGEGIFKDFGKVVYTRLYLKWITNKNLLYSTWNSAQHLPFQVSPFQWCEVVSHCGFDFHFLDDQLCWATFHVSVDHLNIFFRRNIYSVYLPIL